MGGELILIIEDNEKNRKLVRDVLQAKGHKTIESETAEEGLKLAIEKSPNLILMDIQLPGMDGITAHKATQERAQNQKHTGYCDHGVGYDVQPGDDAGRRLRRLSDQADQREGFSRRNTQGARFQPG
jgi:CheY-like chemotaxis protein